jgi:hypothetical protein
MSKKLLATRKLTDAERHKRFVETAREVGASDDPKDFDRAFKKVAKAPDQKPLDPQRSEFGSGAADKNDKH